MRFADVTRQLLARNVVELLTRNVVEGRLLM
jgi:hypothetical protein